jgi:hypothetical protein
VRQPNTVVAVNLGAAQMADELGLRMLRTLQATARLNGSAGRARVDRKEPSAKKAIGQADSPAVATTLNECR